MGRRGGRQKRQKVEDQQPYALLTPRERYWGRRYSLFSLFDLGVELDDESWYSVTPETLAMHHADRCAWREESILLDACSGVGGNSIQLARKCRRVISVEIDAAKVEMARANAALYGVAHKIDFFCGDFLSLAANGAFDQFAIDGVFVSPPWGGPSYIRATSLTLSDMSVDGNLLWLAAQSLSANVAMFLPRNLSSDCLKALGERVEIETNYHNNRCIAITAYWGPNFIKQIPP